MWRQFKVRLAYTLDRQFAKGPLAQFVLLGVLTLLVLLFGEVAYFLGLFSPANAQVVGIRTDIDKGPLDTLWFSLKHVLNPGSITDDYGATLPVFTVALAETLMGMAIFGILIGFISSAITARLDVLRKGNGPVLETGHILLLGWSNKVYSILNLLAQFDARLRVVLLSDRALDEMREALRLEVAPSVLKNVILRTGSRANLGELERVAFGAARSIIVLADGTDDADTGNPDISVIKVLMLLAAQKEWKGAPPKMVAEISRAENLDIAEAAGGRRIPVVLSSEIISKILVQSSRQPGLSNVYAELFSFYGSEMYIRNVPEAVGRRFGDLLYGFPTAVPIGLSMARNEGGRIVYVPTLNPPADHVIAPGEWIVLVAVDLNISFDAKAPVYVSPLTGRTKFSPPIPEQILLLGWNQHLYQVLREFDSYVKKGTRITIVAAHTPEVAAQHLDEHLGVKLEHVEVEYRQASYLKRAVMKDLLATRHDCIIILADQSAGEPDMDARIIMAIVLIRDLQRTDGLSAEAQLISEIHSVENRELLEGAHVTDIVVSPEIVSMLLTQISQQQMLRTVYAELLDAGGNEIYLKPAERYLPLGTPCTFKDVLYAAHRSREIAIGLTIAAESRVRTRRFGVHLNPDKDEVWTFAAGDKVVVIGEDLYD
ncbi:MAG: hypothetical protein HYZ53_02660 [Planctomycetes bacterium]|nr:hypothetical protein [Planctomycetota bacterium]